MKMPQLANLDKFKGEEEAIKAKEDEIENYVIDKDVTLIFLHGRYYQSSTWEELGTLAYFANLGYKIYGIDIPGHGHSQKVTVRQNGWLIETITKLVTSQEEEGNIDQDGGEHHTDSHEKNDAAQKNDVAPSTKKVHKIAIVSPDFSGMFTMDLLKFHQEKLGIDQGIEFIKFIPVSISQASFHSMMVQHLTDEHKKKEEGDGTRSQNPMDRLFDDNTVQICSIGGALDFEFTHNNKLFQNIPNSNTVAMNG
eukprot:372148_1